MDTTMLEYYDDNDNIMKRIHFDFPMTETYTYKNGILISECAIDNDSKIILDSAYYKVKKGQHDIKYFYDSTNKSYGKYDYNYDSNRNLVELKYITSKGTIWLWKSYYNDQNKIVLYETYNSKNELTQKSEYTYDNSGNLSNYHIVDINSKTPAMDNYYHFSYNSEGQVVVEWVKKSTGELIFYIEYAYNDQNELIKSIEYNTDSTPMEKGDVAEILVYKKLSITSHKN